MRFYCNDSRNEREDLASRSVGDGLYPLIAQMPAKPCPIWDPVPSSCGLLPMSARPPGHRRISSSFDSPITILFRHVQLTRERQKFGIVRRGYRYSRCQSVVSSDGFQFAGQQDRTDSLCWRCGRDLRAEPRHFLSESLRRRKCGDLQREHHYSIGRLMTGECGRICARQPAPERLDHDANAVAFVCAERQ